MILRKVFLVTHRQMILHLKQGRAFSLNGFGLDGLSTLRQRFHVVIFRPSTWGSHLRLVFWWSIYIGHMLLPLLVTGLIPLVEFLFIDHVTNAFLKRSKGKLVNVSSTDVVHY
jgi:hypothetical protein